MDSPFCASLADFNAARNEWLTASWSWTNNSDIRENICEYLNLRGHQTIGASDAASAAQLIAEEDIALIVLDVGLPGEDGMSFCRRLRLAGSSMLILMLTARDAVDDRVAGLGNSEGSQKALNLSLIHISEPTRH